MTNLSPESTAARRSFLVQPGQPDNSQAFQRRVNVIIDTSPNGTAEGASSILWLFIAFRKFQPSRQDLEYLRINPGVETPGYYHASLCDD
jgi:hypothetical protein